MPHSQKKALRHLKENRKAAIPLSSSDAFVCGWSDVLKATHEGVLHIGNLAIPCAVLEGGTRVLSENGITQALLGSRSGASKRLKRASQELGAPVPLFLAPKNLMPFISEEFPDGPPQPLTYMPKEGNRGFIQGFESTVLTSVCNVWLKAREAGGLQKQQLAKAQKAEILMRGLAVVGITALVDEATGYQYDRARTAHQDCGYCHRPIGSPHLPWCRQ